MGIDDVEEKADGGLGYVVKGEIDSEYMGFSASPNIGWTGMDVGEIPFFYTGAHFEVDIVREEGRKEGKISRYCEFLIGGILLPDLKDGGGESGGKGKKSAEKANPMHINIMIKVIWRGSKRIAKREFVLGWYG